MMYFFNTIKLCLLQKKKWMEPFPPVVDAMSWESIEITKSLYFCFLPIARIKDLIFSCSDNWNNKSKN